LPRKPCVSRGLVICLFIVSVFVLCVLSRAGQGRGTDVPRFAACFCLCDFFFAFLICSSYFWFYSLKSQISGSGILFRARSSRAHISSTYLRRPRNLVSFRTIASISVPYTFSISSFCHSCTTNTASLFSMHALELIRNIHRNSRHDSK